jgi:hypothetical protein
MRKQILQPHPSAAGAAVGELDVAALATAFITSETAEHPLEHMFDGQRGPGSSHWLAATPGEQTLILAFDAAQRIHRVSLEIEETQTDRTQELQLSVSSDGGQTYRELLRQEYTFSPGGATFEREEWALGGEAVTHLRLWIKPDKGGRPGRASLTSLALR